MSLAEAGEGLLGTHVTWDAIECKLKKALHTQAKFGASKKAQHIGDSQGFMSKIVLIDCDWIDLTNGEKLPKRFVIKMATCMTAKKMDEDNVFEKPTDPEMAEKMWTNFEVFLKEIHNLECALYDFVRQFKEEVIIPRSYYAVPFDDENPLAGQIALEYISNATIRHLHEFLTIHQMKQVARELGKIQAFAHKQKVYEVKKITQKRDCYTGLWQSFDIDLFKQMLFGLTTIESSESFKELIDKVADLIPKYFGSNLAVTLYRQLGHTPVLVNGDLWSANVMVDKDSEEVRALIDWQLAHIGSGAEDLFRISFSALSSRDRREHMEELIEILHESLVEHMEGQPVPYTLEQLKDTSRILMPHYGWFFAPVAMPIFMETVQNKQIPEEVKKEMTGIVVDKVRGIFEDILEHDVINDEDERKFEWKMPDYWKE